MGSNFVIPFIFGVIIIIIIDFAGGYMVGNNPDRHREVLDSRGNFVLEWFFHRSDSPQKVVFSVTAKTLGYVGLGLTKSGEMAGADIVMGGVLPTGIPYLSDMHGVGNEPPQVDSHHQDWVLLSGRENGSHTFLSFERVLDTCDPQDFHITTDKISIIWAFGEEDNLEEFHHHNRGRFDVYLLHPDYTPRIEYDANNDNPRLPERPDVKVWTIEKVMSLPKNDTVYWCTVHKAPVLPSKHHTIGYQVRFGSELSRRHIHHLIMYRCYAPPGGNPNLIFGPWVGSSAAGQQCLSIREAVRAGPIPTQYCTDMYQVWGIGGRAYFHPPHVGQALGEEEDEYYIVQVHYNNPTGVGGIPIKSSIDIFYTSQLRTHEGANMVFRHAGPASLPPSLLIPPGSRNHNIFGLCSSECTRLMYPSSGIRIASVYDHTHNSGRVVKLHQFRNGVELPWITSDENYDNQYQQVRALHEEIKVLPGDQLAVRCVYDNTWTNRTVVGGYSTRQEMCAVVVFYHTRLRDHGQCDGQTVSESALRHFLGGVSSITRSPTDLEYTVTEPKALAGLTISQVSDHHVNWTLRLREELELFHSHHPQNSTCPTGLYVEAPQMYSFPASYPFDAKPYQLGRACLQRKRRFT